MLMMLPIPLIANDAAASNDATVATMFSSFDTGSSLTQQQQNTMTYPFFQFSCFVESTTMK